LFDKRITSKVQFDNVDFSAKGSPKIIGEASGLSITGGLIGREQKIKVNLYNVVIQADESLQRAALRNTIRMSTVSTTEINGGLFSGNRVLMVGNSSTIGTSSNVVLDGPTLDVRGSRYLYMFDGALVMHKENPDLFLPIDRSLVTFEKSKKFSNQSGNGAGIQGKRILKGTLDVPEAQFCIKDGDIYLNTTTNQTKTCVITNLTSEWQ
jgi:hypothetical protein